MAVGSKPVEVVDLGERDGKGLLQNVDHNKVVGKFVLLEGPETVHFIFGPIAAYEYHAKLLDAFCNEREIPSYWYNHPDHVRVIDDSYEIRGGGWMALDPVKNLLVLSGRSTAYGKFDASLVNAAVESSELFRGRETVIE